jgi:hypothetical protein
MEAVQDLKLRIGTEPAPGMTKALDDLVRATNAATAAEQLGETIEGRAQPFDTVEHFRPLRLGRPA